MKTYIGETPIKVGSIIIYDGVKYKILKIEGITDNSSIVLKMKPVE